MGAAAAETRRLWRVSELDIIMAPDQQQVIDYFDSSGAQHFIYKHRQETSYDNYFDIHATAKSVGGFITREVMKPDQASLRKTDGRWWFVLPTDEVIIPESEADLFLFGHELGHVFLLDKFQRIDENRGDAHYPRKNHLLDLSKEHRRRQYTDGEARYQKMEAFCDYFAGKMLEVDF